MIRYLNFTLGVHEIWGPNARIESLANLFKNILQNLKLVNLELQKINPTWTNKISREDQIAKILDIFLLREILIEKDLLFK